MQKHVSHILKDKLLYLSSGLSEPLCLYGLLTWTKKAKSHDLLQPSFITELPKLYYLTSSEGLRGQRENYHHSEDNNSLLYWGKLIRGEF